MSLQVISKPMVTPQKPQKSTETQKDLSTGGSLCFCGASVFLWCQGVAYKKAFTLVEMLMVMMLFLITGGGLITTFLTGRTSYLSSDAYIQVQQEARKGFDNMVRELRESGNVSCNADIAGAACINQQQLNFQVAMGFNAGAIQWGDGRQPANAANWVHYGFLLNPDNNPATTDNQLIRYEGTQVQIPPANCVAPTCRVLANNVVTAGANPSSFSWTPAPANTNVVTINLNIMYQNAALPGGNQTTGLLTSRVKLRNN